MILIVHGDIITRKSSFSVTAGILKEGAEIYVS